MKKWQDIKITDTLVRHVQSAHDKEQQYNDAPPGPWTNNVCSSATRGIMLEQAVEDRPPIKSRVVPQFGLSNGRQAAGVNGNTLIECVPVIFDGWKIHHIRFDGAWIRQGTVIFKNAQISGQDLPATFK